MVTETFFILPPYIALYILYIITPIRFFLDKDIESTHDFESLMIKNKWRIYVLLSFHINFRIFNC